MEGGKIKIKLIINTRYMLLKQLSIILMACDEFLFVEKSLQSKVSLGWFCEGMDSITKCVAAFNSVGVEVSCSGFQMLNVNPELL